MNQAQLNGTQLSYEVCGTGDPVLLIHGSVVADGFAPLMSQPALGSCQMIRYHRRGFGASAHEPGAVHSIAQHAADAVALLHHLGVQRAHVVGHSFGAAVALQLALYARRAVQSLTLLEPPLSGAPAAPDAQEQLRPMLAAYRAGKKAAALEALLRSMQGDNYREALERSLGPAALAQAMIDVDTIFTSEFPAVAAWHFDRDQAARILAPVLFITGDETSAFFQSSHDTFVRWFAAPQQMVVYRTAHLLQVVNPEGIAKGLARFLRKHPMPAAHAAQAH